MLNRVAIMVCCAAVAGCGEGSSALDSPAAAAEVRLSANAWTVSAKVSPAMPNAIDSTLLRSADLAISNGFEFFIIVDSAAVDTSTSGAAQYVFREPARSNTIVGFKELTPGLAGPVYDAQLIHDRLSQK